MSERAAQDPDELFEVVTATGESTGVAKRRADIHRDGDWHRSIHLWFVGGEGHDAWIMYQRRGANKDTSPGQLDPTVGGHLASGETWVEALREAEEEVGVAVDPTMIEPAGCRRGVTESGGVIDREIQTIYFVRSDADLDSFRPNAAEVAAVIRIRIADLIPVLTGQEAWCWGETWTAEGKRQRDRITRDDMAPQVDNYSLRVCLAARAFLRGEPLFCV